MLVKFVQKKTKFVPHF